MFRAAAEEERRVLGMRMDVAEPRHDEALAAVDRHIGWPSEAASDKADPLVAERDVEPAPVDVPAEALVPRDDPGGVLDHGRGHRFAPCGIGGLMVRAFLRGAKKWPNPVRATSSPTCQACWSARPRTWPR